jgi:hypothetical protein
MDLADVQTNGAADETVSETEPAGEAEEAGVEE